MLLNRKLSDQNQPDRTVSPTTRYLIFLAIGLVVLAGTIILVEMDFSSKPSITDIETTKPAAPAAPEARLGLVITHCEQITTALDYTGSTEGNSDYRYIAGYVENHGELTVKFVRVQLIWRDKDDRVVETSEIFAVGEQPLTPGERAVFEDSKRNYLIQKCNGKILDWWVVSS